MSFTTKLVIFWIVIFGVIWLLNEHPNSRASKLAYFWHGPTPHKGEHFSSFLFRRSIYSFKWMLQTILVMTAIFLLGLWKPELDKYSFYIASIFTTTLLCATFLLASIVYICQAAKQYWIGPNPLMSEYDDESNA
jgi:hypothetical protein